MTLTRRTALAGAGIALFAIGRPALAQGAKLRFAHPHPESDSWHKAALLFAESGEGWVEVTFVGGREVVSALRVADAMDDRWHAVDESWTGRLLVIPVDDGPAVEMWCAFLAAGWEFVMIEVSFFAGKRDLTGVW